MNTSFSLPTGFCKIASFAVMSATGADAAQFLHSQLTNDIKTLATRACLAAYCTPKGRVLTDLLVWKLPHAEEETFLLEVPLELQESFQKRLQMFVMRSKVKLTHLTSNNVIIGILGDEAVQQFTQWFPALPEQPYDVVSNETGSLIRLTDAVQTTRYQAVVNSTLFAQIESPLSQAIPVLSEQIWLLSEIHAGIPHMNLATQEKFVPQMINYELIGGVNFKKGCYPGQEIVARTHYLGKQKRRMALAEIAHPQVQSGMEVFAQSDPTQPCGMVVNAQPNALGGSDCLIEIKTAFLNNDIVSLISGEICHWLSMPYELPVENNK